MKVQCPECNAGYQVDEEKIPEKGTYTRCKKCQTRFLIQREPEEKKSGPARVAMKTTSEHKQLIDQYLAQDDQGAAAKLLLELITKCAREKNFPEAETLMDKLYEAAPLALNEIVKAGEAIEEEKQKSMDSEHLEIWSDLYQSLEPDEAVQLYYSMNETTLKPGQLLFEQGQHNLNLYFVQSGFLKLFYQDPATQEEAILKELSTGDVANVISFFSFTQCTHTLAALSETKLTYLEKEILTKWKEKFPGIEAKLKQFCQNQETIDQLIQKEDLDLRKKGRIKTSTIAMVQLLDDSDRPILSPFKVTLYDISAGGLSYNARLNKGEEAERLLGSNLVLQLTSTILTGKQQISQKGKIIAVNLLPFGESSVHVVFQTPLDERTVEIIGNLKEED